MDEPVQQNQGSQPTPDEVHRQLSEYLLNTENLLAWLKEGLIKGEEQLVAVKTFDTQASGAAGMTPINTDALELELQEIRKHILSLEELRAHIMGDIERVNKIRESLSQNISQFLPPEQ